MRRLSWAVALVAALSAPLCAEPTGHYVPGVEGLGCSTLPPPGWYYRNYEVYYTSSRLSDKNGKGLPIGFTADVYAQCHRVIWLSNKKFLGATYGADVLLPVLNTHVNVRAAGVHNTEFGLGDLYVAPLLLSWHGPRYDAGAALGAWLPTGSFSASRPASPGKGHYTVMATAGGTGYLDQHKTISASALSRWEVHTANPAKITPGADLVIEWGLGKALPSKYAHWNVGVAGYGTWQLTNDTGKGVNYDRKAHNQAYAAGPEISAFVPAIKCLFSLRSEWEFATTVRSQGNVSTLTVTKIF